MGPTRSPGVPVHLRKKLLLRYVKFHLSSIWTCCYAKWSSFYVCTNLWVADSVAFHLQTALILSCTFILIWCYFASSSLALANSPNYVSIVDAVLPSFSLLWSLRPFPSSSWRTRLSNETRSCKDSEISAMPPLTGTQSIGIDRPTLAVTDRVHWDLFCQHGRAIRPELD